MRDIEDGIDLLERGDPKKALRRFKRAVSKEPGNPEARVMVGAALYALRRYDDTRISCEETMRLVIEVSKKLLAEAESFGRTGRHGELNAVMRRVERVEAVFSKARCIKAKALFMSGKHDAAMIEINAEIGADMKDPKGAALLCMVINELCMEGDPEQAERVRLSKPDEPALYTYKELARRTLKTYEEKYERAMRDVDLRPDDAAAYAACSDALRGLNNGWAALDTIKIAVRMEPQNVRYLCTKAAILRDLELMEDFGRVAREALEADPEDPEAMTYVGFSEYMDGDKEVGMGMVHEAFDADDSGYIPCLYLTIMLTIEGDVDVAMSLCKPAVLADPHNGRIRGLLARLLEVPGVP